MRGSIQQFCRVKKITHASKNCFGDRLLIILGLGPNVHSLMMYDVLSGSLSFVSVSSSNFEKDC